MRYARFGVLILWGLTAFCGQEESINVNSRYAVEKFEIKIPGAKECKLSKDLRGDIVRLIGQKFDQGTVSLINKRVKEELKADSVVQKLVRGDKADQVAVTLEVSLPKPGKTTSFGANGSADNSPTYHSKQGWSGHGELTLTANGQKLPAFGITDDGDQLTERYAGFTLRYQRQLTVPRTTSTTTMTATASGIATSTTTVASDSTTTGTSTTEGNSTKTVTNTTATGKKSWGERLKPGFLFEDYHIQWNSATLAAEGGTSDIYRTRQNFEPTLTITPISGVTVTAGASFERLQMQYPAAHTAAANSVTASLSYHRQLGSDKRSFDTGYNVRAATRAFASDYVYVRHMWNAGYTESFGNSTLSTNFTAGTISGNAPVFERYILGNSSTLRGWNKYDLAPLGGSRVAANSVEYRYRLVKVFYDAGSVWSSGESATVRHAAGIGLQYKYLPQISVAFPIRSGRVEPVFMVILI